MKQADNANREYRIPDIMIGLPDGLTIPFIVVAGMTGAAVANATIYTAGLIVTLAGATAMGLGRYFTGRPNEAPHRVHDIGLSPDIAEAITQDHAHEKSKWDDFIDQFGLDDIGNPDPVHLRKSAWQTTLSYLLGGTTTLAPFLFTTQPMQGLKWSATITIVALLASGYIKGKSIGINPWGEATRLALTGILAALAAYFAAKLLFHA